MVESAASSIDVELDESPAEIDFGPFSSTKMLLMPKINRTSDLAARSRCPILTAGVTGSPGRRWCN